MIEKKKATFSLPVETLEKLEKMSKEHGMTKSGLINFLIQQAEYKGTIFLK